MVKRRRPTVREEEIEDAGLTPEAFAQVRDAYAAHGIDLNRVPRRGWRICGVGVDAGPTYLTCWASLGALVAERESFIAQFERLRRQPAAQV